MSVTEADTSCALVEGAHSVCVVLAEACALTFLSSFPSVCVSGGETSGAGEAGFPQHTQEADRLSAGPAGRGRGQEVCQVTLGERK